MGVDQAGRLIRGIDVGHQQLPAAAVPGETVWLWADRDLVDDVQPIRINEEKLAGSASGRESDPRTAGAEHAASLRTSLDNRRHLKPIGIDDIDRSKCGVGDEHSASDGVHVAMVEGSCAPGRERNPSPKPQRADQRAWPASFRHQAYKASYIGVSSRIFSWSSSPWTRAKPWAIA